MKKRRTGRRSAWTAGPRTAAPLSPVVASPPEAPQACAAAARRVPQGALGRRKELGSIPCQTQGPSLPGRRGSATRKGSASTRAGGLPTATGRPPGTTRGRPAAGAPAQLGRSSRAGAPRVRGPSREAPAPGSSRTLWTAFGYFS